MRKKLAIFFMVLSLIMTGAFVTAKPADTALMTYEYIGNSLPQIYQTQPLFHFRIRKTFTNFVENGRVSGHSNRSMDLQTTLKGIRAYMSACRRLSAS